jgi:lactate dehydrogenase-like 2-hydroxyacid dehydrogenase
MIQILLNHMRGVIVGTRNLDYAMYLVMGHAWERGEAPVTLDHVPHYTTNREDAITLGAGGAGSAIDICIAALEMRVEEQ